MSRARSLLIEGGVGFLLIFTPLAFGGVEYWAMGVIQAVTGLVLVAWAWSPEPDPEAVAVARRWRRRMAIIWVPPSLFLLLAALQLVPLAPPWVQSLAPGVHRLYAETLPGYSEGGGFAPEELVPWLVADQQEELPGLLNAAPVLRPPDPPGPTWQASAWRPLSLVPEETLLRLTLLLCYAALFAVVLGHFRTRRRLARLLNSVVAVGFAVSLLGILQKLAGTARLYGLRETEHGEFFGPFVNRNSFAAFAGTIFPLALCLALAALGRLRAGREGALPRFLFFALAAVIMGGSVFYSLSRGGMLAAGLSVLVAAALLFFCFGHRGVEMAVLAGLLALAVGFVAWVGPDEVVERVGTLAEGTSTPSLTARVAAWIRAMDVLGSHPVLGTGLGTFRFAFMEHAPPGRAWWTTAHNEYIEILCDTGVAGGVLLALTLVLYSRAVLRPGVIGGRTTPYAWTGVVAGLAGLLLHAGVSSVLQVPANGVLLVTLGGGLLGLVGRQELRAGGADRRHRRPSGELPG